MTKHLMNFMTSLYHILLGKSPSDRMIYCSNYLNLLDINKAYERENPSERTHQLAERHRELNLKNRKLLENFLKIKETQNEP